MKPSSATNLEPETVATDIMAVQAIITDTETKDFYMGDRAYSITREYMSNGQCRLTIKLLSDKLLIDTAFDIAEEKLKNREIDEMDPLYWL